MQLDFQARELTVKLVYYGPALSGKTTNLQAIHRLLSPEGRGRLMTLETRDDRTLFFDLLPLSFNTASGLTVRIKLFTVPGQVIHNSHAQAGAPGRRRRRVHRRLADPGDPREPGVVQGPAPQPARERARAREAAAGHPVQQARPAQHPQRRRHRADGGDGQGADVTRDRDPRRGCRARRSSAWSTRPGSTSSASISSSSASASRASRSCRTSNGGSAFPA